MAKGPSYRVPFRRRREGKTDYQSRRGLILSEVPRIVVRPTLRYVIVQVVEAKVKGDQVIVSAHSSELAKTYGWRGGFGNIPAAYLTGLLCGLRALIHGMKKMILDIGLNSPSRGSRVFAALKGILDAGITVPHEEDVLPDENRINGGHIIEYASKLSSNSEAYQQKFSKYLLRKLPPEQLSKHYALIMKRIKSSLEKGDGK